MNESKASRAVENARDYSIQVNSVQACEADYHGVFVVSRTLRERMDATTFAEKMIGKIPGTVP